MNMEELWNKYKSACEIEGAKLEYISKQALTELVAEIISQPLEAEVKPASGGYKVEIRLTKKLIRQYILADIKEYHPKEKLSKKLLEYFVYKFDEIYKSRLSV